MNAMLRIFVASALCAGLAGCATSVVSDVTTFGQANVPPGATVQVVAKDADKAGSLEFKTYANMVGNGLGTHGFKPTPVDAQPQYLAQIDYSVDDGKVLVRSDPDYGYMTGYYGRPWGWGPYPYWGAGYYDPFYEPYHNDIQSYVVYRRTLHVAVVNAATNQQVFEGKVESMGKDNHLNEIMPYMVSALFQNYPGNNGKTVRVKTKIPSD